MTHHSNPQGGRTRGTWLAAALAALALAACTPQQQAEGGGGSAESGKKFHWRLVTSWPKNYPGIGMAPEDFARRVEAMSNGRLRVTVYGAGELVPPLEVFDAVRSGSVQAGHSASYYWRGKVPAAQYFTAMPFGMTTEEATGWLYQGGGLELWREVYEPFNLVPFPAGSTGLQWMGWYRKDLRNASDVRGLLIRMPGVGGEVIAELGAEQVQLPGSEIFTALQTGAIDAAEWVGPYNDQTSGFHQVAPYYYYPGWQEAGPILELIINKQAWEELPADLQAIVESASMATHVYTHAEYTARNPAALQQLKGKGVDVRAMPDEALAQLRDISRQKRDELGRNDPMSAKVHRSWDDFHERVKEYRRHAEDFYVRQREP